MSNQAFHDCVQPYFGSSFWDLTIEVQSYPGKDGCLYDVEAWICPECHGNNPCPKIACRQVAIASVDNLFNVTNVTCNF